MRAAVVQDVGAGPSVGNDVHGAADGAGARQHVCHGEGPSTPPSDAAPSQAREGQHVMLYHFPSIPRGRLKSPSSGELLDDDSSSHAYVCRIGYTYPGQQFLRPRQDSCSVPRCPTCMIIHALRHVQRPRHSGTQVPSTYSPLWWHIPLAQSLSSHLPSSSTFLGSQ